MAKLSYSIALNLLTDGVKKGAREVEGVFKRLRGSVTGALGSIGLAFGIGGFARQMVEAGRSFEDGMARVRAVSNATEQDFKRMADEAKRLGSTTKYSATEAAGALESLVRNGLTPTQATAALSKTLQLAQANSIELAEAADLCTNTMNGFGMKVDELGRVNDVLSSTAAHAATNVSELGMAMTTAAPLANNCKVGIQETSAALGVLANVGIKGADAGTALKQFFMGLSTTTDASTAALKKYGLVINQNTIAADGLLGTLKKMADSGIGRNNQDLADVFGRRAFAGAAALINNYDRLVDLNKTLAMSTGETERMFAQGTGAMENAIKSLQSAWEGFQIKVFESGGGLMTSSVNAVTAFVRFLSDNLKSVVTHIAVIFAGMKLGVFFRRWATLAAEGFSQMVVSAQSANRRILALQREATAMKKQAAALEAQLAKASADERLFIEVQLEQKMRALRANGTAILAAQKAREVAVARAAAMQEAGVFKAMWVSIKAGAASAAASIKAAFAAAWPMLLVTAIVEVVMWLSKYNTALSAAETKTKALNGVQGEAARRAQATKDRFNTLRDAVKNASLSFDEQSRAARQANEMAGQMVFTLDEQTGKWRENSEAVTDYMNRLMQLYEVEAAKERLQDLAKRKIEVEADMRQQQETLADTSPTKLKNYIPVYAQYQQVRGIKAAVDYSSSRNELANIAKEEAFLKQRYGTQIQQQEIANTPAATPAAPDGSTLTTPTTTDGKKSELQKWEEGYADSLRRLTYQRDHGLVTSADYDRQLRDLTEQTLMEAETSRDRSLAASDLARQLRADAATLPTREQTTAARSLEDYADKADTLTRQLAAGAITEERYTDAMTRLNAETIRALLGMKGLTDAQRQAVERLRDKQAMTVGVEVTGRDRSRDYAKSRTERTAADLEAARHHLEQLRQTAADTGANLDAQIAAALRRTTDLDRALRLAEARAALSDFRRDLARTAFATVDGVDSMKQAWEQCVDTMNSVDADGWEKVMAVMKALEQTLNSILSLVDNIQKIGDLMDRIAEAGRASDAAKQADGLKQQADGMREVTAVTQQMGAAKEAEGAIDSAVAAQKQANTAQNIAADQASLASTTTTAATEVTANTARGASGAAASAASLPFPYNIIAMAGAVASVLALMASLPKFAQGGVVAGGTAFGDMQLARVNGGEMILNGTQQRTLFDAIDHGALGRRQLVVTAGKMRGEDIYLSVKNYMKRTGKTL